VEQAAVYSPVNGILSDYIASIWTVKSGDNPAPYLLPPDPGFNLIFSFDSGTVVRNNNSFERSLNSDFCTGLRTRPVTLFPAGPIDYISVQLKPLGFRSLFGRHAEMVKDGFVDVCSIKPDVSRVRDSLCNTSLSVSDRIALIEELFVNVARAQSFLPPPYLERAVTCIEMTDGNIRVGELCDDIGITTRQLQREFDRWLGVSIKFYMRIVRFNRALELLETRAGGTDLADLSLSLGYYDQSHLCSDFAELAGLSPSRISGTG
jgi:AraC-like DNA-binding protein